MSELPLLKPELYGAGAEPNEPVHLYGGRCNCGYVFFPFQTYGCENCGASGEQLAHCELVGRGELVASAPVHVHKGEGREAPFVVGAVRLEAGPVVRTLLDYPAVESLQPGCPVTAVLLEARNASGDAVLDLRFRPQTEP